MKKNFNEQKNEKIWYVHYCDIGEEPFSEPAEGFVGPYTYNQAYNVMESMDKEETIAGQNFYYNTYVVNEDQKKALEVTLEQERNKERVKELKALYD